MHPYFKHLLQDIRSAHNTKETAGRVCNKSFEEEMNEVEKWVAGDLNEHIFGYYCGLQPENFPPPEQFNAKELELINQAFEQMLFTYNHAADFPKTLPVQKRYAMLVNTLNEKTFIPAEGMVSFDYCTGYPPDCVFKEHCSCLNIWNSLPEQDVEAYGF